MGRSFSGECEWRGSVREECGESECEGKVSVRGDCEGRVCCENECVGK